MANRKGKGRSARTSSADSKTPAAPPPDTKTAANKRPKRSGPSRSKPPGIPPNWFTSDNLPPRRGTLSMKLPTDYVVCMRGLAKLHNHTLFDTFSATLWSYLKLTRADQLRAMDLEPAMPVQEVTAWGGVNSDGSLLPWASRDRDHVDEVIEDDNRIVRVVIRHLPSEPGIKPRGWKE